MSFTVCCIPGFVFAVLWSYIFSVLWLYFLFHSCWITDDAYFYSLNLAYFALIFSFNFGILIAVASSICKMKQGSSSRSKPGAGAQGKPSRVPQRFSDSCKTGLTVLCLTSLLGITWGLAFLSTGYVNYPILYLFCILNSTQGLLSVLSRVCLCCVKIRAVKQLIFLD